VGPAFTLSWTILQWPVIFALVTLGVAMIYYYAPDAVQEWIWITPGSLFATTLWLAISLVFKFYVSHFTSYNATYGTIGGVIVLMLWFYLSALAVLVGAELNAEIEHASPYGKDPGEKVAGEKKLIGAVAEQAWMNGTSVPAFKPAIAAANCDLDTILPPAQPAVKPAPAPPRPSDWILAGLVLAEVALVSYARLRLRFNKITS
jgi:hypothetical protein